jgi:hypothetical protein
MSCPRQRSHHQAEPASRGPSGFTLYPGDISQVPRTWLERTTNLVRLPCRAFVAVTSGCIAANCSVLIRIPVSTVTYVSTQHDLGAQLDETLLGGRPPPGAQHASGMPVRVLLGPAVDRGSSVSSRSCLVGSLGEPGEGC